MATSTYKSFLMKGTTSSGTTTWEKLIDITEFPDIGADPDLLETTTLSDGMKTFIMGIQNNEGLTFKANYTKADYTALAALAGSDNEFAVWFGGTVSGGVVTPDGSDGKYTFNGELAVHVDGGSVNEVRTMTITIAPSTMIIAS